MPKNIHRFVVSALTLLLSVGVLYAATTIGSNIVTGGNLTVTGDAAITGNATTTGSQSVSGRLKVATTTADYDLTIDAQTSRGLYLYQDGLANNDSALYVDQQDTVGSSGNVSNYGIYLNKVLKTTNANGTSYGLYAVLATSSNSTTVNTLNAIYGSTARDAGGGAATGVRGNVSGSAANSYGFYSSSLATGENAYAGFFTATGAATTNYGLYANATGASTNYAGYFAGGSVHAEGNLTIDGTAAITGTTTASTVLVIPSGTSPSASDSCANTATGAVRVDTNAAVGSRIIWCDGTTWQAN